MNLQQEARRARRATGALFFSVFGTLWLVGWSMRAGLPGAGQLGIVIAGLALTWACWATRRRYAPALQAEPPTAQRRRADRVFHIVNAGQWILMIVLGNVLSHNGLSAWIVPMALVVIGLHFLPLAWVFGHPPHVVTGVALVLLGLLYPFVAPLGPLDPVGFLGAGSILWLSALWAIRPVGTRRIQLQT